VKDEIEKRFSIPEEQPTTPSVRDAALEAMQKKRQPIMSDNQPKRDPVQFDYTALNWTFLRRVARIPLHAAEKYGSWDQYKDARLVGEKSPINHALDHLAKYMNGEPYDRWDGAVDWHLVAAAYNCMMEFFYFARFGHAMHPLAAALKEALTREAPPI